MTTPNDAPRPTSELVKWLLEIARWSNTLALPRFVERKDALIEAAASLQALEARNKELEGAIADLTAMAEVWSTIEGGKYIQLEHSDAYNRARAALHPATKTGET